MIGGCLFSLDGVVAEVPSGGTASAAAVIGGGGDDDPSWCFMASTPGLGPTGATASAEIIGVRYSSFLCLVLISECFDGELSNTMKPWLNERLRRRMCNVEMQW